MSRSPNRRRFLGQSLCVTAGLAGGSLLTSTYRAWLPGSGVAIAAETTTPEQRLRQLGIELPPAPKPVAVYVPTVQTGNLLFASGHGPVGADGKLVIGRVGSDLTLQQGYDAARLTALAMLSSMRSALGSLDKVVRLVKVTGMVNCTPSFTQQPEVINGFSELMVQVFGENQGKGARSAVGMGSLPRNIPVEIEAIFEIRA